MIVTLPLPETVFAVPSCSSSSGSESGSSQSRSTTPSSFASSPSAKTYDSPLPTTYVHLPSSSVRPDTLKAVFDRHAEQGTLGLYIDTSASNTSSLRIRGSCTKQHLASVPLEYYLSTSPTDGDLEVCESVISTDPTQARHLLAISLASLRAVVSLPTTHPNRTLYILERPAFSFLPLSHTPTFCPIHTSLVSQKSTGNIPTPEEWDTLWAAWDLVTLQMIPEEMLHQKPIDLRHKCLFYIGHIPTFLDMLLSKSIGGSPSEPKHFWNIFERGIDPHVDDPDHCHNHSEVPEADEDWPTIDSIVGFRNRVRARLMQLYDDLRTGKRTLTRNIARTLVMTHEHEGFHIETLLYMLMQRAGTGTLPPPGFTAPPWDLLVRQWHLTPPPCTLTVTLGPTTIVLGHDDSEAEDKLQDVSEDIEGHTFGWDNESPRRKVEVGAFRVDWRPVSNGEFEAFWKGSGRDKVGMPMSWVEEDGVVKVRTMYGPISMDIAQDWPVLTSYDDLLVYARSKGGRLPTEPELRLFLDTYDVGHEGGANSGFRNWHPVPATTGLAENDGRGSNGGVWEWTSTLFDTHDGLAPTNLFTGYSTDFFDTKHQVVLGASYATIPRLASRRTVRNFYQHNYPYPWVGGRVVYDS